LVLPFCVFVRLWLNSLPDLKERES
jgi:hypothetical protein